ncbi:MAG: hypothetical protein JXM71_03705 [Spirochaetales bacterium]|nr:hypothetical protein [Spirochaetales bacterium]
MGKKTDGSAVLDYVPGWVWSAFVAAWALVPFFTGSGEASPGAFGTGSALAAAGHGVLALAASTGGWVAVALAVWKGVSFFARHKITQFVDPRRPFAIALDVISSAAVLLVGAAHAMAFATRPGYFGALGWWAWAVLGVAFAVNAYSLIRLIAVLSERDAGYREYIEFRRITEAEPGKKLPFARARGIQGRLTAAFTALILLIVMVLSTSLLSDFGTTLLSAIMDNGSALADRTASIVKSNISDRIALEDYLAIESRKNEAASFPFASVSYYRRDPKADTWEVRASTDQSIIGQALDDSSALLLRADPAAMDASSMTEGEATIEFRAPVVLSGVNLGFVSVVYDRQTIYGPYYLTRVKAAIIAFLFLYASVFVTYLFGRGIVFPILYLRMSVNSIAGRLSAMVRGETRVSADNLRYEDRVATKDEIKKLSVEIGNMASVIRGIVPYISASTLKHAERDKPTSERRELAYLFTDIRGFTTICEGLSPEDVVSMLNHYLDLQTQAIVANGGDIDKFVGDEVMAVFDGPDKEARACRAGMDIRKVMAEAQEKARNESSAIVSIGIGINSGPVVFGSVGARERMDFTSIGDTVNLAARLEGANKTYGTKSLITETVYEKVKDDFLCREIDLIAVKGKNVPVRIFEVLQDAGKAAAKLKQIKEGFEVGLAAYRAKKWAAARKALTKVNELYGDEASAVFLRRIDVFEASPPPADWDGVFRMTVK